LPPGDTFEGVAQLSLPARWYHDPEAFDRERRAIFGRTWLFAGFAAALREPGDYLATELAGWPVVLVVDDDGRVRGHHNVCRHRAGPLVPFGSSGRVPSCWRSACSVTARRVNTKLSRRWRSSS